MYDTEELFNLHEEKYNKDDNEKYCFIKAGFRLLV